MTGRPPVAAESRFPDPRTAPGDAPLAWGTAFDVPTLLDAYRQGIFPWPAGSVVWWWSPDPRAVIPVGGLHRSRSLQRTLRAERFTCTRDAAFDDVVAHCAQRPGEGTWITPGLAKAYRALHAAGHAHSVEAWQSERLVGGVFGVSIGGLFTGESMFYRARDASKVALAHLEDHLLDRGFALFDVQMPTAHLASLGALEVARDDFLDDLAAAVESPCEF